MFGSIECTFHTFHISRNWFSTQHTFLSSFFKWPSLFCSRLRFADFIEGSPHLMPNEVSVHAQEYGLGGSLFEDELFCTDEEDEGEAWETEEDENPNMCSPWRNGERKNWGGEIKLLEVLKSSWLSKPPGHECEEAKQSHTWGMTQERSDDWLIKPA